MTFSSRSMIEGPFGVFEIVDRDRLLCAYLETDGRTDHQSGALRPAPRRGDRCCRDEGTMARRARQHPRHLIARRDERNTHLGTICCGLGDSGGGPRFAPPATFACTWLREVHSATSRVITSGRAIRRHRRRRILPSFHASRHWAGDTLARGIAHATPGEPAMADLRRLHGSRHLLPISPPPAARNLSPGSALLSIEQRGSVRCDRAVRCPSTSLSLGNAHRAESICPRRSAFLATSAMKVTAFISCIDRPGRVACRTRRAAAPRDRLFVTGRRLANVALSTATLIPTPERADSRSRRVTGALIARMRPASRAAYDMRLRARAACRALVAARENLPRKRAGQASPGRGDDSHDGTTRSPDAEIAPASRAYTGRVLARKRRS